MAKNDHLRYEFIAGESTLKTIGKIIKINNELEYAFAFVEGIGKVFISPNTKYSEACFQNLTIGDIVQLSIEDTERGLHAAQLIPQKSKVESAERRPPETSI